MPFGSLKQTVYLMPDAGANPIKVFYTYGQIKRHALLHLHKKHGIIILLECSILVPSLGIQPFRTYMSPNSHMKQPTTTYLGTMGVTER